MSDDTPQENQNDSGYAPIRVESFWGAVSLIALCQVYYFILFEGFVFVSGAHVTLLYVWFGILFFVSVGAQVEVMVKINVFFDENRLVDVFYPGTIEEWIKFFLAIWFGTTFIWFCLGYYPFPSMPHQWWQTLLFYTVIWFLSFGAAVNFRNGIDSKQPRGMLNVIPVIMGMGFFTAGAFAGEEIFYMAGTFGMGFAMIPVRSLLLANNSGGKR